MRRRRSSWRTTCVILSIVNGILYYKGCIDMFLVQVIPLDLAWPPAGLGGRATREEGT